MLRTEKRSIPLNIIMINGNSYRDATAMLGSNMIVVKIRGGLGNQMFQYAAGRMLALANTCELKLDLSWFKLSLSDTTARKYELGVFEIAENFSSFTETAYLRLASAIPFLTPCYKKEASFNFDPSILKSGVNTYLDGYWQSYKYFQLIHDVIQNDFKFKYPLTGENIRFAEQVTADANSVAVHIRRGDYISNRNNVAFHGICPLSYYSDAVERIRAQFAAAHFYVFSDDPSWVRENFPCDSSFTIVDHNTPDNAAEDLRLMTLCKHHIIANSTFSWWGAWLCRNPGKVVIAPQRWFNDPRMNSQDLIPDTWIRI